MIRGSGGDDAAPQQLTDEAVPVHGNQAERAEDRRREISDVEGHNDIRHATQGCCQDVTVVGVRQRQALLPPFVPADSTSEHVPIHELARSAQRWRNSGLWRNTAPIHSL